jgi:hypothetical protein
MHMDKRLSLITAAMLILTMLPIVGAAAEPLGGPKTYTTVVGLTLTLLPHNLGSMHAMNALVVYYTIHQPLHAPRHGVFLMQHVTFTGAFNGHVHHLLINGQFAGKPIVN